MGRHCEWQRVAVKSLDRRTYGPVIRALRHRTRAETFLLHVRFISRNHPWYRQLGLWAVVIGTTVVRRKPYRFKAINESPTRWANGILRLHDQGVFAREAAERAAARAAWESERAQAEAERNCPPPHDEVEPDPFDRLVLECYERRIGPIEDKRDAVKEATSTTPRAMVATVSRLPVPPDDRPRRLRSVVNYHLPASFDELPAKLAYFRHRTSTGWVK